MSDLDLERIAAQHVIANVTQPTKAELMDLTRLFDGVPSTLLRMIGDTGDEGTVGLCEVAGCDATAIDGYCLAHDAVGDRP